MNGIILDIYRSNYNSKLNRLDGKKQVFWRCPGGYLENAPAGIPEIIITVRDIKPGGYLTAYSVDGGGSFGGAFVYSSDSRFSWDYPIPLHDRVE